MKLFTSLCRTNSCNPSRIALKEACGASKSRTHTSCFTLSNLPSLCGRPASLHPVGEATPFISLQVMPAMQCNVPESVLCTLQQTLESSCLLNSGCLKEDAGAPLPLQIVPHCHNSRAEAWTRSHPTQESLSTQNSLPASVHFS